MRLGSTQPPPGADTHMTIVLLMTVLILPQYSPTSGFQKTICANETPFAAAIELQLSPILGAYGLHFKMSGRHMVPDWGNPRQ